MANHIKPINKTSVHKICSGQVVLSLAIAIKELVENSLDAGATVVDVRLKEYGSELIEVTDNGSGVHPHNFEGLTLKHHTSKLKEFSDIVSVETFGFRGEALSSLCALSNLSVLTRHESQSCGTNLVFDHNGHIIEKVQCARQVGTTVTLSNLFSTLPVRHKEFLRNLKREFNKMTQLLYAYCLVSTGVKITCVNHTKKGSRTTFVSTQGSKTVKENIACVFGSKQLLSLLEIKEKSPPAEVLEELNLNSDVGNMFKLGGFISTCKHGEGRSSNDRQFYYINSRPCEPSKVMKTVTEVYHQYNMHQSPFVFLNISVAREAVDVNVTPDKRQIFLDHEKLLLATIKASLLALYESVPSTFSFNNVQQKLIAPKNQTDSVHKSPLSLLSQWRHKLDKSPAGNKRCLDTKDNPTSAKQMKLDSKFALLKKGADECGKESYKKSAQKIDSFSPIIIEGHQTDQLGIDNMSNSASAESEFESQVKHIDSQEHVVPTNDTDHDSPSAQENDALEVTELVTDVKTEELTLNSAVDNLSSSQDLHSSQESTKTQCQSVISSSDSTTELGKNIQFDTECMVTGQRNKSINIEIDMNSLRNAVRNRYEKSEGENKSLSIKFRATIDPTKNSQAEQELSREISKDLFSQMNIIGQFNLGFIITQLNSDLFIIDQHATDEKYNFETLQKNTTISNQVLVVPQKLDLTAVDESTLIENIEIFRKNGFDFKIDESAPATRKISLASVPMCRNFVFGKEDIDELLFMLQNSPNTELCRPSRVRAMFASRACRKSVMIGTSLSKQEMKRLVDHMGEIEQPWNCPHGRPTMRHLVNLDLLR